MFTHPATDFWRAGDNRMWNLLWLAIPEIDHVFNVIDKESMIEHQNVFWPKAQNVSAKLLDLSIDNSAWEISPSLHTALVVFPPTELVMHIKKMSRNSINELLLLNPELLDIMQQRALLSEAAEIITLNSSEGTPTQPVPASEFKQAIAPSVLARTSWLDRATERLRDYYSGLGITLPKTYFIIDKPSLGTNGWCKESFKMPTVMEIGINECLCDARDVLNTLAHELVHAVDRCIDGHGCSFTALAHKMGFKGKGPSIAPDIQLAVVLDEISKELGTYPHFQIRYLNSTN